MLDTQNRSNTAKFTKIYNFHFRSCKFADVDARLTVFFFKRFIYLFITLQLLMQKDIISTFNDFIREKLI